LTGKSLRGVHASSADEKRCRCTRSSLQRCRGVTPPLRGEAGVVGGEDSSANRAACTGRVQA